MKKTACVAALVLAFMPVSGLAESSKPDVKKQETKKPKEKKAKSEDKKSEDKKPEDKKKSADKISKDEADAYLTDEDLMSPESRAEMDAQVAQLRLLPTEEEGMGLSDMMAKDVC